jgi:hypothetical protein
VSDPDPEGGGDGEDVEVLAKPDELLALHGVTEVLFAALRSWFGVPPTITLDISDIDSAVLELGDPQMIAGLAMRKLQALRLLATPGVRTTTDVVVAIVNDLDRALYQAPDMWLRRQAEQTDWDAALADLADPDGEDVGDASAADNEAEVFRELHQRLHDAAIAVVEVSGGEIRVLE